jgi:hypothetical protein
LYGDFWGRARRLILEIQKAAEAGGMVSNRLLKNAA